MCRSSAARSPWASRRKPSTAWTTTKAWATRSRGQKTTDGSRRDQATAPQPAATALEARTPMPIAAWSPLTMRPSALCSTPAQASLYIRPRAQELCASSRVPGPRHRGWHGIHAPERRTRTTTAGDGEAGVLRVRPALGGPQELQLGDQLLPDRDALHPLRHRGGLPLSGRASAQGVRRLRVGGDDRLRSPAPGRLRLRLAEGST